MTTLTVSTQPPMGSGRSVRDLWEQEHSDGKGRREGDDFETIDLSLFGENWM